MLSLLFYQVPSNPRYLTVRILEDEALQLAQSIHMILSQARSLLSSCIIAAYALLAKILRFAKCNHLSSSHVGYVTFGYFVSQT